MWDSRNRTATGIVLKALRKYAAAIASDVHNFSQDGERTEELDEAIRITRTMRCATSLIGSFALSRLVTLQEEVLESVVGQEQGMDEPAVAVLTSMLEGIDAYAERVAAELQNPGSDAPEVGDELVRAVKAFRRYRGLPEEEDEREIARLLYSSGIIAPFEGPVSHDGRHDAVRAVSVGVTPSMAAESTRSPGPTGVRDELEAEAAGAEDISPELREVFQLEAEDLIDRIYRALGALETEPGNRAALQEIRRAAHTLKGAAGAVGLKAVSRLAHRMEDLLDALYDGAQPVEPQLHGLLSATIDMLADMSTGDLTAEHQQRLRELYGTYQEYCSSEEQGAGESAGRTIGDESAEARGEEPSPERQETVGDSTPAVSSPAQQTSQRSDYLRVPSARLHELAGVVSELIVNRISMEQEVDRIAKSVEELSPIIDRLREVRRECERHDGSRQPLAGQPSQTSRRYSEVYRPARADDEFGDFDQLEFDRFTNRDLWSQSLSESTSDCTTIWQDLRGLVHGCELLLAEQRRLTQETQDRLLHIQMVPFGSVLPQLQRAVREVASREGKEVAFVVNGQDVELDKIVLERTVEPLLHLLRNAVDHGIEAAEQREANGKPVQSNVTISVVHFGTQVIIRVSDDGQGLDAEKIRNAAVQGAFVTAADVASCSLQDLYRLIFLPGFTTASSVNEISGRGVGMDVVQSKIAELNGKIDVDSAPGEGTTFTIRLPVSLAVTRALIVNAEDELLAIPQGAVTSIQRRSRSEVQAESDHSWLPVGEAEIPLVRLATYLGLSAAQDAPSDTVLVAILGVGEQRIALEVDGILPSRDIVVRDLGIHLANLRGLLGATILGNGRVVPILDPTDLILLAVAPDTWEAVPSALPPLESRQLSVMIVDDSVSVRRVMQTVIGNAGWTPITARDGIDALEILESLERPPDVFLLDVEMPRMNGFELLGTLRDRPEFESTPINMITSRSGEKHRQQAVSLGSSEYLSKPVHEGTLIQIIRQQLAGRQTAVS